MGEITGRKVLFITVSAFSVIIGVNLVMAWQAISTFPGLEVENSYVASQSFDSDKAAQLGLGWTLASDYDEAGKALHLSFTGDDGLPADVATLTVLVGRTTEAQQDQRPQFDRASGFYSAPLDLQPGKWMMHVEATARDGTPFRQRIDLFVEG
ncbi:nitrogen fixation protein FixH [Cereibacter changlensis]|uniref:Nitrogen fixation protein FixH n=1 Tax=Cereibacter changlensis TaxID=402884 RepID=A0A4U0YZC4_9RHOB|nr:FixH family protein [Cereibacter changlensis]TKA97255.1 nitrogen fixation protein FixH [Cereibacter changlensis]